SDVNAGPLLTAAAQARQIANATSPAETLVGLHLNGEWSGTGKSGNTVITLDLTVENGDEIMAARRSFMGTGGANCVLQGSAAGADKVDWLPAKITNGAFSIPQLGLAGDFGTNTTASGSSQFVAIDATPAGCNGTFAALWTAAKK